MREARFVLELIGPRYADPAAVDFPELLADSIANQGLFVGPGAGRRRSRGHLEDVPAHGARAAARRSSTRDGKHPDGHPLRPLYWLANYLAEKRDAPLRAGQIVTTGSYCGVRRRPVRHAADVRVRRPRHARRDVRAGELTSDAPLRDVSAKGRPERELPRGATAREAWVSMSLAGLASSRSGTTSLPAARDDFHEWHNREHMPERVGIPGFRRGRRYVAISGAPEFFNLYEADSPETLAGQDYLQPPQRADARGRGA